MKALSLRRSVIALAFCCVLIGQLISAVVLVALPYEAPRAMTLDAALGAVSGKSSPGLERRIANEPPVERTPPGYAQWVSRSASVLLRRPLNDIRVRPLSSAVDVPLAHDVAFPDVLAGKAADPNEIAAIKGVPFPPFELAVVSSDGTWQIAGPVTTYFSRENLRILFSFAVAVVCLAPVIWWNVRRLTRPLHFLAEASAALGRNPGMEPLKAEGPREVQVAIRAFNHMSAEISRQLSERATLVAALAHDLRTPLTSLRIHAETAPLDERRKMAGDISRLDALVSDMLMFARGARPESQRVRVDIHRLAKDVVEDARDVGHTIGFVASGAIWVLADPSLLRRVLDNLVSNALAYGRNVQVSVEHDHEQAEVHVTDDGPGVPEHALERVFEPFFRLETSRSRKTGGTGLGLAIARAIARAHGGEVRIANRKTGGLHASLALRRIPGAS